MIRSVFFEGGIFNRQKYNEARRTASNFTKRKWVRELVFKRDNYRCVFCGRSDHLTVDHIKSVYTYGDVGGTDNLQTLCRSCNCGKSPMGEE